MPETAPEPGRMAQAHRIAENPSEFKVCEGCDSIVAAPSAMCPNCHSYRFDGEAERVVEQAMRIGAREQRSVTAEDLG